MIARVRESGPANRRWWRGAAALVAASLAAADMPSTAWAQAAPAVTVRQEIVARVPAVKRVVALAEARERRAADGTRELAGAVRIAANVPCVLRVSAADAAAEYGIIPGVAEVRWRLKSSARPDAIRYELVEARGVASVRASSPR